MCLIARNGSMYQSKQNGRNQTTLTPEVEKQIDDQKFLNLSIDFENDLNLENDYCYS